jgi:hypothetical protein
MMDEAAKHRMAERLTELTGGKIRVTYEPDAYFQTEDESVRLASIGHQYAGTIADESLQEIWLDDRESESLDAQMARKLWRIALELVRIATVMDQSVSREAEP